MGHKTRFVSRAVGADADYYTYYTLEGKGARVFCKWRRIWMPGGPGKREEMSEPVASFACDAMKVEADMRARARVLRRILIFDSVLDCLGYEMYASSFSSVVRGAPELCVDHDIGKSDTRFMRTLVAHMELFPASGTRKVFARHQHFPAVPV